MFSCGSVRSHSARMKAQKYWQILENQRATWYTNKERERKEQNHWRETTAKELLSFGAESKYVADIHYRKKI